MIIELQQGDVLTIQIHDSDGEFEIHYNSERHPDSLLIKETGGMSGNIIGEANEIIYYENFSENKMKGES